MLINPYGDYSPEGMFEKYIKQNESETKTYQKIINGEQISESKIKKIIQEIEKKDCELRTFLYQISEKNELQNELMSTNFIEDIPVKIKTYDHTIGITVPAVIKKNIRTPHYIKMHMRAAFMRYRLQHPERPLNYIVHNPISILIIRYAPAFNTTQHVDNDNYEVHDIINAIMEELGTSDNAENMDYSVVFRSNPEYTAHTEILVSSRNHSLIRVGDITV